MPPTARKTPQDRKPKTKATPAFTFEGLDGKTYELPHPSAAMGNLPGRVLRDAMLGGEGDQAKFAMMLVEACDADPASMDALYELPAPKMMEVIGEWMKSLDASGASLPQS